VIVEVIAVGTELLLGQIINSNVAEIGTRLAEDGFDVHHQVTVGDNVDRMVSAIRTACERADAVILTGGIGPTQDDLTRDAICSLLGVGIERDEAHAALITNRLAARGVVADTALRMADYPAGSQTLANSKGIALGIATSHNSTPIFAVPGVPTEMRAMIDDHVRPRLRAASGEPAVLASRVLHTWGFGESQIAEKLDALYESSNPTIAFLINGPEVRVRITAKAATRDEVDSMIDRVEVEVRARLGDAVFATNDETVDRIVVRQLAERDWTIATVEVATAGMLAARLATAAGFVGGVVSKSTSPLDIEARAAELLREHGPANADVVVAVTEATEQAGAAVAVRTVGVAIRTPVRTVHTTLSVLGDDERVRQFATPGALHLLRRALTSDD
jgi:nicotinamide-nucleotide amidase